MESQVKVEVKQKLLEDEKKELRNTKSKLVAKHDPKLRMSYVVPEEIYPENIDL